MNVRELSALLRGLLHADVRLPRSALPGSLKRELARLCFTARVRERCWNKLGRQLSATRLPLERCFAMLEHRADVENSPLALVYSDIMARLARGDSVGKAIGRFAYPEEALLIDSGQTAGEAGLSRGFTRAAELLARQRQTRAALARELAYPLALAGAVCGFLVMISWSLIPQLARLSNPQTWHGAAAVLYAVAGFTASWKGLATVLAMLLAALACAVSMPRWTGRARRIADKFPPWSFYRLLTGTGWLYATAILLETRDIKLSRVLERITAAELTSPYLRWRLTPVLDAVRLGHTLGDSLCRAPDRWPDPAMADDLRVYSTLPGFGAQLKDLAGELLEDSTERARDQARMLGGLAMLLLTCVICLLVAGLFGIQDQVTGSVGAMGHL